MRTLLFALPAAPLLTACPSASDDDDDGSTPCEGSFTWVIEGGDSGEGAEEQTCALSQGPTFITINTFNEARDIDWQMTFSNFGGEGTWDADDSLTFAATGTFDVTVQEYVEEE